MVPIEYFIGLSIVMFVIGVAGVLLRRNALVIFMSLELMFNAANLLFVTFAAYTSSFQVSSCFLCDDGGCRRGCGWSGADR